MLTLSSLSALASDDDAGLDNHLSGMFRRILQLLFFFIRYKYANHKLLKIH